MNKFREDERVRDLGIYIHIPFCNSKCAYCDFYSKLPTKKLMNEYTKALCKHLAEANLKDTEYEVDTIYFGGGTPTVLGDANLCKIAAAIYDNFMVPDDCETTLEANPESVTLPLLKKLYKAGFNRISFGAQSSSDEELMELSRIHTFSQVEEAVDMAHTARFTNVSLDLMYGLPGQTMESFRASIKDVIALSPTHISCYALKLEAGTPMAQNVAAYDLPSDDAVADMYLMAVELLLQNGYVQYEISNFAKPGFESKHNRKYWNMSEYWGFGPSAHSFMNKLRFSYIADTEEYIDGVLNGGVIIDSSESANAGERAGEYLMLALRTTNGISAKILEKKYLTYFDEIEKCMLKFHKLGLADFDGTNWRLTPKGFLVSNTIITDVLIALEKSRGVVNRSNIYNKIV
ncbi:MAG: radical SAM family heme chaperone HemW [Clostridia bacterium]